MPPVDTQRGTSSKQILWCLSVVPLVVVGHRLTHHNRNTTDAMSALDDRQGIKTKTYPIKQKLSKNPASSVTSWVE